MVFILIPVCLDLLIYLVAHDCIDFVHDAFISVFVQQGVFHGNNERIFNKFSFKSTLNTDNDRLKQLSDFFRVLGYGLNVLIIQLIA